MVPKEVDVQCGPIDWDTFTPGVGDPTDELFGVPLAGGRD
jgi:hypothetical protein